MSLADRIKSTRKARKLTQAELARRAGMSLNGIAQIEQGGRTDPHISTLIGIARSLGVAIEDLLDEEPPMRCKRGAAPGTL